MPESIGTRLREAREKRQLSLQQASDTTKVRIHYLQALENDDVSAMPSAAQARGFLRIYAEFLGLEVADLIPQAPAVGAPVSAVEEPKTEPRAATARQVIPASPDQAAKPSLLDQIRSVLTRRSKTDVGDAAPAAAAAETVTDLPAEGAATTGKLDSDKKKVIS